MTPASKMTTSAAPATASMPESAAPVATPSTTAPVASATPAAAPATTPAPATAPSSPAPSPATSPTSEPQPSATTPLGQPIDRVDGRLKVTGRARYAAEFTAPGLTYGVVVSSTIARGRIISIDARVALRVPGVLHVFTHENRPPVALSDRRHRDQNSPEGAPFRPLQNDRIVCSGQPVALVVAQTFEAARHAAALVEVCYAPGLHDTNLLAHVRTAFDHPSREHAVDVPPPRGDADSAFVDAHARVDVAYHSAAEHHNPMEMHASTVLYEDDGSLTVYDKTQGVQNTQAYVCQVFGLQRSAVRVLSPFVGGAFGSALRPQYHLFLAVMAARALRRSVRVSLTRQQMFTFGHRPETWQRVALGASAEGRLEAIIHEAAAETSRFERYHEPVVDWSGVLYRCDHVRLDQRVVPLDVFTPLDMRAPGAALGVYALECAMDELSYVAGIDPLALRLANYAEDDQSEGRPFSSKALRACYAQGAARFGWADRAPKPRARRDGHQLIGWGMAGGVWEATQMQASARVVLAVDGRLIVSSATADIGTGTYTVMAQIAADALGVPIDRVTVKLGDSSLPQAPLEGSSWTVSSVGTAIRAACEPLRERLLDLAQSLPGSPLSTVSMKQVTFADGTIQLARDPSRAVSLTQAMRYGGQTSLEATATTRPRHARQRNYTCNTHAAVFAEVKVDEDFGSIAVTRVVSAIAAGRILNPKTAGSQIRGGVVWGIGMALEEESVIDQALGRYMTHNLADYHIPVHADVHDIDVIFVDEPDDIVNPLGVKGVGEIGIVGVAAAIANAVYHATGTRVRSLPITLDKLF